MAQAYAVTFRAIGGNQPLSVGSAKAVIVELDITSYASPVVLVPEDFKLSKIYQVIPCGITDQAKVMKPAAGDDPASIKLFAQADGTTEVVADADAGMMQCVVIGA